MLNGRWNAGDSDVALGGVALHDAGSVSPPSEAERSCIAIEGAPRCWRQPLRAVRLYVFERGGNRFAILGIRVGFGSNLPRLGDVWAI